MSSRPDAGWEDFDGYEEGRNIRATVEEELRVSAKDNEKNEYIVVLPGKV